MARLARRSRRGTFAPRTSHLCFRLPAGQLRHAWKTLLQNHPHDSICGCSIDAVHEENMTRFARARQVGDAVVDLALDAIADSVPAASSPSVIRAVVVNTDAIERAQVVEAFIDLPVDSAEPWRKVDAQALDRPVTFFPREATITGVTGPDGTPVEFQILGEAPLVTHVMSRYETPWALNVRRAARAVVGAGAAAVRLRGVRSRRRRAPAATPPPAAASSAAATSTPRTNGSRSPSTTTARSR